MEEIEAGFFTLRKMREGTTSVIYTPRRTNLTVIHNYGKSEEDETKKLDIKWKLYKYPRSIMI